MVRFKPKYLFLALALLLIEICIALYVHDSIIRPYVGDFLVVFLVYYFIRAFITFSAKTVALITLCFSFAIEIGQYFNLVGLLGLQEYKLARIVIGTSFHWLDLMAYALGVIVVFWLDLKLIQKAEDMES